MRHLSEEAANYLTLPVVLLSHTPPELSFSPFLPPSLPISLSYRERRRLRKVKRRIKERLVQRAELHREAGEITRQEELFKLKVC